MVEKKKTLVFFSPLLFFFFSIFLLARCICTAGQLLKEYSSSRISSSSSSGSSGSGSGGGSGQQERLKPPVRKVRVSPRLPSGVFCCSGDGERYIRYDVERREKRARSRKKCHARPALQGAAFNYQHTSTKISLRTVPVYSSILVLVTRAGTTYAYVHTWKLKTCHETTTVPGTYG